MNKQQWIVVITAAAVMLVMLLFPPFELIHKNATLNQGYALLFDPPEYGLATVNIGLLLMQWVMVMVIASVAWLFFRDK